jgi:hypothetical protein
MCHGPMPIFYIEFAITAIDYAGTDRTRGTGFAPAWRIDEWIRTEKTVEDMMAIRTRDEINEIGFKALVEALGKEDALRFIRGITGPRTPADNADADEVLPPWDADEAHERIMDMHGPSDQAALL